jgi:hypothetical protein
MAPGRSFDHEAVNDFWGFLNQQDEIRYVFVLARKVPGEGFPDIKDAHIRKCTTLMLLS